MKEREKERERELERSGNVPALEPATCRARESTERIYIYRHKEGELR